MQNEEVEEKQKIEDVTQIFRKLNIPTEAKAIKDQYYQKAFAFLDAVQVPDEKKESLKKLAKKFVEREV